MKIPFSLSTKAIDQWLREDWCHVVDPASGWTVAHDFAFEGKLPEHFEYWDIIDGSGDTVAHCAGRCGKLPERFTLWQMTNSRGWSVAHSVAASHQGIFPDHFSGWDLDMDGESVLSLWIYAGKALPDHFRQYDLQDSRGETIESLAKRFRNRVVLAQLH